MQAMLFCPPGNMMMMFCIITQCYVKEVVSKQTCTQVSNSTVGCLFVSLFVFLYLSPRTLCLYHGFVHLTVHCLALNSTQQCNKWHCFTRRHSPYTSNHVISIYRKCTCLHCIHTLYNIHIPGTKINFPSGTYCYYYVQYSLLGIIIIMCFALLHSLSRQ